ncbi:elongation factor 2 [Scheffersomyces amazonensis]|uniref:elongation factor 2 n=1 Tax=Scheffersomyces amazonensis TaxID=1078765 RepID=UPI00315D3026
MSGSIVRALNWDIGYEQQFLAINPIGDEVLLYQTNHEDPGTESNDLIKINSRAGFENIQCSAYSIINKGLTGVGSISGNISIFDINSNTSSILKLKPKQNRPCNSISFNHSNLIVGGFDKGRQDNSLQIWNIEHYSRNSTNDHIKRPVATYLPNEAILSAIFYPDRESSILCGSYKFLREIDLRSDQPAFQMATKCTLGLTVDHFQNHLFQSFSEDGSLAIWDRRKLTTSNSSKGKASLSSGYVITETPVLQFSKLLNDISSRKNQNPCVRYSTIRRGEFSAVFNGDLIRRWHTGIVPDSSIGGEVEIDNKSKKDPTIVQSLKQQSMQLYKDGEESLFVSLVLDVKTDYERVVSFDYSPDIVSNTSTNFVCMRQSGSVFRMPVVECVEAIDFNSLNEFTIAGPEGTMSKFIPNESREVIAGRNRATSSATNNNGNFTKNNTTMNRLGNLSLTEDLRKYSEGDFSEDLDSAMDDESVIAKFGNDNNFSRLDNRGRFDNYLSNNLLESTDVINNDICTTIRRRAIMGYGVDFDENVRVLETLDSIDTQLFLRNTWKWLSLAKKSLDKGTMISEGIDLGYQGVLGIWKGVEELRDQNRSAPEAGPITDTWFSHAVKSIVSSKGKKTAGINISSSSERKIQRKLCLIVSGWYLADNEFEEKLDILVSLGFYEKAAGWAVFHGDVSKAIEILGNAKKEKLRLISTAVAGYLAYKNSNVNSPWKDQCRKMASELDDPYLRAIFAFIADNDWWDVLDEHALPLRERLGVALRFLSDKDLNVYLNRIADSVVSKGELEGLILTGLTPRGMDLLQSYVNRTSDVQTAALISAFACPRYFSDDRIKHWVDCYRSLLNSWGLFKIRAKFDVSRTKLSKNYAGNATIKASPKQVYLQCSRCNKNISKSKSNSMGQGASTHALLKQFNKLKLSKGSINACPHCGAPLPRCSICLLSLGAPLAFDSFDDTTKSKIEDKFKEWFSFCLSCNHGCHAHHAEEWFSKHYVCPVPDFINDVLAKIDREKKVIQGFQNIKKNSDNAEVIQKCNSQIRETQQNITFLEQSLVKINLQVNGSESESPEKKSELPANDNKPIYSRFDLIKYDCPSLGHKIQYMLQHLPFKLQAEYKYREANEKIHQLYLKDGDKSSSIAAEGGKMENDQKISLLKKALRKYQNMHIDLEEFTKDFEMMTTPKHAIKPLTGKLTVSVTCIRDVDHIASPMLAKKPESIVVIKIDDVEKARTKPSRTNKWNEELSFHVEKGKEIELAVFDKSANNWVPVAVNWALLSDITEEIRKKKVANELGSSGWMTASNLSHVNTVGGPNQFSNESDKSTDIYTNSFNNFSDSAATLATSGSTTSANADGSKIQINSWLSLEPVGQILVTINFEKTNVEGKKLMGAIERHGAIKKKKDEVFEQHGHQFVQKQFYNVMCCALCGEFLRYTGYQCQDCKFLCHKKCYQKVVTKCISKSSTDDDDETKLNHRIPHRFVNTNNSGTKWCCHCGYLIPWVRKKSDSVRKCSECHIMCHAHCTHLVPDLCGMSMETANTILMTIKSTKPSAPRTTTTTTTTHAHSHSPGKVIKPSTSYGGLPSLPSTAESYGKVSDNLTSLSDDEADTKDIYDSKLPTQTTNAYQQPVQHPYASALNRRPPPTFGQQQGQVAQEQISTVEEPHIPIQRDILPEPQIHQQSGDFDNFDYNNHHTDQYIPGEVMAAPRIDDIPTDDHKQIQHVQPPEHAKVKGKRRKRRVGLDDFQFLAVLGKGNFGKVMLAQSRDTYALCAIKVLKKEQIIQDDAASDVKSEKRVFLTVNKERHPFLLNLHCCFQSENRIYFVMEYISGGDLMFHVQNGKLHPKRAKFYACEILLGLEYFHQNGIVYRDLKLENILLTSQGHIKIGDYGLCKENMWYGNTTGSFCGTPEFMAPEIVSAKPYDRSVDWWAFGVLFFQMLLRTSPFKGEDEEEIFNAILNDDVKYPIYLPRQTVLVLQGLLTKDPTKRLGGSERDAQEIKEHEYFSDVNFDDVLHMRIPVPFVPELNSEHDYSNFDKEFTSETPRLTPVDNVLSAEVQEQFRGFSHIADNATI